MSDSFDFFISYRRRAAKQISPNIKDVLDQFKYRTFFDLLELRNSNDWKKSIDENLPKSKVVIVVLAKESFVEGEQREHDEFLYEIGLAIKHRKPVITIDYNGFFLSREQNNIRDKRVVDWLCRPTALELLNSDPQMNKTLRTGIVKRMKDLVNEGVVSGSYLPEKYLKEKRLFITEEAQDFFKNDGKIDSKEVSELLKLGRDCFLPEDIVHEIIEDVVNAGGVTVQHQIIDILCAAESDRFLKLQPTDEAQFSSISKPVDFSRVEYKKPVLVNIDEEIRPPSNPNCCIKEYDQWEYFRLGAMTVSEVLNSPEKDNLASYIAFYAFQDGDQEEQVLKQLRESPADQSIMDAINKYTNFRDPGVIGNFTIARAKNWSLARVIAEIIGEPDSEIIEQALNNTQGKTKVRNAFCDNWPENSAGNKSEEDEGELIEDWWDYYALGSMKAGDVLSHPDSSLIIFRISLLVRKTESTVKKYLKNADSQKLVHVAVKKYKDWFDPDFLGGHSVADAKYYGIESVIAEILGNMDINEVLQVLKSKNGHTLLRNAFSDNWPE